MTSKLIEIKQALAEAQKRLNTEGTAALKEELVAFINRHPIVDYVRWGQGTPSFNDGDPCRFRLGGADIYFTDGDEAEDCWYDYENKFDSESEAKNAATKDFANTFGDADDLFETLGDGLYFKLTREGVEEDGYYDSY